MKNKELRECPFCGGEAIMAKDTIRDTDYWIVICSDCDCNTICRTAQNEAIKAWNTRTNKIPVGNRENYEVVQG